MSFLHLKFVEIYNLFALIDMLAGSGVRKKISGGFKVMAGLVDGPGAEPPPRTPANFRKIAKFSLRKWQKCIIFAYFAKEFKTLR